MRFIGAGSRPGHDQVNHDLVLTVPNLLTVVRFLGVPLFIWLILARQDYALGLIVLLVMAGTDWVDGYIARRFDQASRLGRVLDPLADRLALICVAATLVATGVVHWLYLAALLIPDAVLLVVTLSYFRGHPDLPVSTVGKVRTGLLLVGTPLLLLSKLEAAPSAGLLIAAWIILALGLVGHWIAAYNYFRAILAKGRRLRAAQAGPQPGAGSN